MSAIPRRPEVPAADAVRAKWTVDKHRRDAVPRLRVNVRNKLAEWGIDPQSDHAFAVGLVVTELITNAFAYGSPVLNLVDVFLWPEDGTVNVLVWDSTHDAPTPKAASGDDESGRGLLLVDYYAADHGWYLTEFGKRSWAVVDPTRRQAADVDQAAAPAAVAVA